MGIELGEENAHAFEAGVHALPVKRDHGVCGVADDDGRRPIMIWLAVDRDKGEMRVTLELADEILRLDERCDAGEVFFKKGMDLRIAGFEEGELGGWHEECAGEGAVDAGNGDEHMFFTRPDVEMIG